MYILKRIGCSLDAQLSSHQLWFNHAYVQHLEPLLQQNRIYEQSELADIDWFKDWGINVLYLVANIDRKMSFWCELDFKHSHCTTFFFKESTSPVANLVYERCLLIAKVS